MSTENKITSLIAPIIENMGYELFRVKHLGNDLIQVMIDKHNGVNIEDCTQAAKVIRHILQIEEITKECRIEVSSPGLDRPLLKPEHYNKFINSDVKIVTNTLIDGQKRFLGKLVKFQDSTATIVCADKKEVVINLDQVETANLYYKG
jgi:ribosome maturation factor RimP